MNNKSQTSKKPASGQITIRIVKAIAAAALASAAPGFAQSAGAPRTAVSAETVTVTALDLGRPQNPAGVPVQTGSPEITTTTEFRAETAYFLAVGQRGLNGPESFVVPVSGAAEIAVVRQYLGERAAGTERRPLIPTVRVRVGTDGENRNHSAPGAPLWNWSVIESISFARYTWPEVEPAVYIASRDSSPSEIEGLLRGTVVSLPNSVIALRGFPIVMELRSEFPRSALANVSDRGFVGAGNEVKITGFVVSGGSPRNVVIRALGPTLAVYGVPNVLANPRLAVYRGTELLAENDDWAKGNLNRPHITVMPGTAPFHLIPNDSREPALELTLEPGAYTVIVSGVGETTGVVLTEVHMQ